MRLKALHRVLRALLALAGAETAALTETALREICAGARWAALRRAEPLAKELLRATGRDWTVCILAFPTKLENEAGSAGARLGALQAPLPFGFFSNPEVRETPCSRSWDHKIAAGTCLRPRLFCSCFLSGKKTSIF